MPVPVKALRSTNVTPAPVAAVTTPCSKNEQPGLKGQVRERWRQGRLMGWSSRPGSLLPAKPSQIQLPTGRKMRLEGRADARESDQHPS